MGKYMTDDINLADVLKAAVIPQATFCFKGRDENFRNSDKEYHNGDIVMDENDNIYCYIAGYGWDLLSGVNDYKYKAENEKPKKLRTKCSYCGASLPMHIISGEKAIKCEYCGNFSDIYEEEI